jgi:hypothetical protein
MLFLSPIFMWILAFSNEKYEDKEIEKEYSCRKWILISIGVALIIAISDAAITYYKYKAFYDYFKNAGYENLYDDSDTTDTEYYDDYEVTTKKLNVYDATENYWY